MTIIEQVRRLVAECLELPVASLDVDMEMDSRMGFDAECNDSIGGRRYFRHYDS